MKKHLLLLFVLLPFIGFSQQKTFQINWEGEKTLRADSSIVTVPYFNKDNFNFSNTDGLKFFAHWKTNNYINESSVQLANVSYSTISATDLKGVPVNTISNSPELKLSNAIARDDVSAYLELKPIVKQNGVYKKITSFTVSYSTTNSSSALGRSSSSMLQTNAVTNSVLASGSWYRFYVDTTGVFRLTKSFLNQLGVNTNSVDPRNIKVYGNGGAMLPKENSVFYPIDLTENAIKFVGEEDGDFDNDDYILFYAEGPRGYNEESNTNINAYTDKSYYYINISSGMGKRIQEATQPNDDADFEVNTFQDYQFHEIDQYNLVKVGRRWFGDRFDIENEKEFTFTFPNLVTSEPARVRVYAAAVSEIGTSMEVKLNGNTISNFTFAAIDSPTLASGGFFNSDLMLNSPDVVFNLKYNNNNNPASLGYLDYISVEATRELSFEGGQFTFKNANVATSAGIAQYNLANAANVSEVWDITDKYNVVGYTNSGQSSNFSFKTTAGTSKIYLAVTPSDYFQPLRESVTTIANQNIKGTIFKNSSGEFEDIDYLIISPNALASQAERLAQINRDQYGLTVKVVTLNEIYNEFSSGNVDVTAIRNLVRYVYHNASAPDKRLKYLCLFGDASYDHKERIAPKTDVVPSWHSYASFSLTDSFVSDDYYGLMDENEGNMAANNLLDIAVGRILAQDLQSATELVDKIDSYYKTASFGSWRNNYIFISDDVDEAWERTLQETTDDIADLITEEKPFINAIKIHSDSYQQESTSSGDSNPSVNRAIRDAIDVGALVVNYFGHGGEDGLSGERIFDKNDSQEVNNTCKYNCFVTVTCEYTRFDDPLRPTAGEYTYWNKEGGAIALITTTRQIFVSVGVSFNIKLTEKMFAFDSNEYTSIAEALRLTKTDPAISGISQKRLVFFIGDPAMKLALPKSDIRLTAVNDVSIDQETDVLKALDKVKLSGEVVDESGNLIPNYNGVLTATVFDKNIERQTLGNDGTTENGQLIIMDFETLGEIIFKGQATVENGQFDFEFVVPRDISIPVGNGKVSFYAQTENPAQDQTGASFDIQVGGINENAEEDNIGPVINLYMNDENFVSGGITNEAPTLLAKLQDDNGINTSSGVGHDIVAIIDGDEANPYILNDYYQANVDDYQNGEVTYPFRDLEPGLHTLTLKAWDVYNNSSTSEIQFVVHDKDEKLVITNVLNYPNPFVNYTEFWFNHNSSDNLDVSIQIFTVSGKLVRTLNGQTNSEGCCNNGTSSLSRSIVWDGRDDFGDKIGKGVYIYKLKVRSNQLNKQVEKIQKLVIL